MAGTRTVLSNGAIYDGSGAPSFIGDVLIEGGCIKAVGRVDAADAERTDCTGLAIAPGFIDIHSHSDVMVLTGDRAKTDQGVTTEVVGNCGFSPYPCGPVHGAIHAYGHGILSGGADWGWSSAAAYLAEAAQRARLANVWSLVGHGTLRTAFLGARQDAASPAEMDTMEQSLDEALAEGACGFSTGLMYAPGSSAPRDELVRLCKVVARRGKVYATHMRSYSFGLLESIDEQLGLARDSGCRLQISHLQAVGRANWDKQRRALDRLEAARDSGVDVAFDSYPYLAGSTVLTQLLPQWTLDQGPGTLVARLGDPALRRRIAEETISSMAQEFSDIHIAGATTSKGQKLVGQTLTAIAAERGVEPIEAVFEILIEENCDVTMLSFNQSEDNLRALLTHPLCTVISDGFYVNGRPHPRLYGTFPSLLGLIARDRGWMSLAEAVHRITGKPAARYGMTGRGTIAAGAVADITVFDAARIAATATYESPVQRPEGVVLVFREGTRIV